MQHVFRFCRVLSLFIVVGMLVSSCHRTKDNRARDVVADSSSVDVVMYTDSMPVLSFRRLDYSHELDWINELEMMKIPYKTKDGYKLSHRLNVYYRYAQPVDGYTVIGRFIPFAVDAEAGYLIEKFSKGDDFFYYFSERHSDFYVCSIANWKHNDVYEVAYIPPTFPNTFKADNGHSSFGYYTPFFFLDIDFDGEKELLVSDLYQGQIGNYYTPYNIVNHVLQPFNDKLPFSQLTHTTVIDTVRQCITLHSFDGAFYEVSLQFKKQPKCDFYLTRLPQFQSTRTLDLVDDYRTKDNCFSLDSVSERVNNVVFEYARHGTSLDFVGRDDKTPEEVLKE